MNERSIVILPQGTDVPEEVASTAEIIAFLQQDGSVEIFSNVYEGPSSFKNVNELFNYVGKLKKSQNV